MERSTSLGDRNEAILRFLRVVDALKSVECATYLGNQSRHESVAEHTWHMCMYALLLSQEMDEDIDLGHALKLILVHDLAEILVGNPFAYDVKDRQQRKAQEERAAAELFSILPSDMAQDLLDAWREVEGQTSREARFAKAIDRLQPFAQNTTTRGRVWRERGVTEAMSRNHNRNVDKVGSVFEWFMERLYREANAENMWPEENSLRRAGS